MNVQESLALPRARDTIGRITPYVPGKSIEEVAAEYGVRDVVKLASNENPLGPSPRALEAVRNGAGEIFRYPDGASGELIALLAERLDVPQDHLVVGNGSDEVIKLLAEAYLEPGDEVIYADPTFSEYAYVARLMGAAEIPGAPRRRMGTRPRSDAEQGNRPYQVSLYMQPEQSDGYHCLP